jgi:hypothetical protein
MSEFPIKPMALKQNKENIPASHQTQRNFKDRSQLQIIIKDEIGTEEILSSQTADQIYQSHAEQRGDRMRHLLIIS